MITVLRNYIPSLTTPLLRSDIDLRQFDKDLAKEHKLIVKHFSEISNLLALRYRVSCEYLAELLLKQPIHSPLLTTLLLDHLIMVDCLILLHQSYLNVPREVIRLQKDKQLYQDLLQGHYAFKPSMKFKFSPIETKAPISSVLSTQRIRENIGRWNWPRLFIIRSRRVSDTFSPVISSPSYSRCILYINYYLNPVLLYLSWAFYIPRFLTNAILFLKHLIPCSWWMTKEEMDLGCKMRFKTQFQRRGFELLGDIMWLTAGLITFFTSLFLPIIVYVPVALAISDAILAWGRRIYEFNRLDRLLATYKEFSNLNNPAEDPRHMELLEYRVHIEKSRPTLGLLNTCLIAIGMCLTLPCFAAYPIIPFLGTVIVLLSTLYTYFSLNALNNIPTLNPHNTVQSLKITSETLLSTPKKTSRQAKEPSENKNSWLRFFHNPSKEKPASLTPFIEKPRSFDYSMTPLGKG